MNSIYMGLMFVFRFACVHPVKYLHSQTAGPEVVLNDNPEFENVTSTYECLACGKRDIKLTHLRMRGGLDAFINNTYDPEKVKNGQA